MRRFFIPFVLVAALVAASVLTVRTNNDSDPGHATAAQSGAPAVSTPLLSVRRIPEWLRRPTSDTMLGRAAQTVLANPLMPATRCVTVYRDGIEVARNDTGPLFSPGSLQRLITLAASMSEIPTDSAFRTEAVVRADSVISDTGVLDGDIWLVGGGDPVLSTADYVGRFPTDRPFTDLAQLADTVAGQLATDGITSVAGGILGDESKYAPAEHDYVGEETPSGPVWAASDNAGNRVGPLSALMVNEGFTSWPDLPDASQNVRSRDPALDTARVFADLLAERGIQILGRSGNSIAPQGGDRRALGLLESPPFSDIMGYALSADGATASEMILKEIGVRSGVGAVRANAILFGEAVLLDRAGLPVVGTAIADGSGLSSLNQTSCDMLVAVVDGASGSGDLMAAVPSASEGPLADCIGSVAGDAKLLAVSEADTVGVVGSITSANGDLVSFAMLANDTDLGSTLGACNALQAAMVDAAAGHPYGPALDDLAPSPPVTG